MRKSQAPITLAVGICDCSMWNIFRFGCCCVRRDGRWLATDVRSARQRILLHPLAAGLPLQWLGVPPLGGGCHGDARRDNWVVALFLTSRRLKPGLRTRDCGRSACKCRSFLYRVCWDHAAPRGRSGFPHFGSYGQAVTEPLRPATTLVPVGAEAGECSMWNISPVATDRIGRASILTRSPARRIEFPTVDRPIKSDSRSGSVEPPIQRTSQFSSVVEQRFCKPSVVGSIPTTGSSFPFGSDLFQRGESSTALPKGWQGNWGQRNESWESDSLASIPLPNLA